MSRSPAERGSRGPQTRWTSQTSPQPNPLPRNLGKPVVRAPDHRGEGGFLFPVLEDGAHWELLQMTLKQLPVSQAGTCPPGTRSYLCCFCLSLAAGAKAQRMLATSAGTPPFTALHRYCISYKLKVGGNPALSKYSGTISPTPFAHFVSLCHVLLILTMFQMFFLSLLYLSG